jgi:hypothetical protein
MIESNDMNWANKLRDKFFMEELVEIWNNQEMVFNDSSWHQLTEFHQSQWKNFVNQKIQDSSSLYWYSHLQMFDENFDHSEHLNLNLPTNTTNAFSQLRLLNKHNEKIDQIQTHCKKKNSYIQLINQPINQSINKDEQAFQLPKIILS